MTTISSSAQFMSERPFNQEGVAEREPDVHIVEKSIQTIDAIQNRVTKTLHLEANSPEAIAATDQALVHIAESNLDSEGVPESYKNDAMNTAIIESAIEIDYGIVITRTPVAVLELHGRGEDVNETVARLYATHAVLPNGHEAAPLLMEAINELSEHPVITENPGKIEFVPAAVEFDPYDFGVIYSAEPKSNKEFGGMPTQSESAERQFTDPFEIANRQARAEFDYDISIEVAGSEAVLSAEEIYQRLNTEHVVKEAKSFADIVSDKSRNNKILVIDGKEHALGTQTSAPEHAESVEDYTERGILDWTDEFINRAIRRTDIFTEQTLRSFESMRDSLTYIGEKEYAEAAAGIAGYWKSTLDADPDVQVLPIVGEIDPNLVKSDHYLLDNILKNFTDEELDKYKHRLILDAKDINVTDPTKFRAIMLDDWTISGSQMKTVRRKFGENFPHLKSALEVQLIVADERRIKSGLEATSSYGSDVATPIRAFYKAHNARGAVFEAQAHITGSHSSVDFDFEQVFQSAVNDVKLYAETHDVKRDADVVVLSAMPPTTNIVRPYRLEGYKPSNIQRLISISQSVKVS